MSKKKGHYEGGGYTFDEGETPECYYCQRTATIATAYNGVFVCDDPKCHSKHVEDMGEEIVFVEDEG